MGDNAVIPFGKYKGKTVEQISQQDPQYLQWLKGQSWFIEKYQQLIINNFGPAEVDTPEHNAFQARFLDKEYCEKFIALIIKRFTFRVEYFKKGFSLDEKKFEPKRGGDVWLKIIGEHSYSLGLIIELKISLGDDYPSVMRQISQQQGSGYHSDLIHVLIIKEYAGNGCSYEQVYEMFRMNHIFLIKEKDFCDGP